MTDTLLDDAETVAFGEIDAAIGRAREKNGRAGTGRALVATIVAVGPPGRMKDAVEPIRALGRSGAIRGILVPHSESDTSDLTARVRDNVVVLQSMRQTFVENAVATLRLSSLPTLIWWRGGDAETLEGLVKLSDRLVLDADPPEDVWRTAVPQFERTAFSDLRWTRLTRWRALMAQFFDLEDVREAASRLSRLAVSGSDAPSARLFAAWIRTTLPGGEAIEASIETREGKPSISRIVLGGDGIELSLEMAGTGRCVSSSAAVGDAAPTSRVVSLGQQSLMSLLSEELSIRARDDAFERALSAVVEAS